VRSIIHAATSLDLTCADASVAMDVLVMTQSSPQLLKLDHCCQIVSCVQLLIMNTHEAYVQTAVETALVLLRTFGEVIQQTCRQGTSSVGVDLSFEDRRNKCESVRNSLKQLCLPLQSLIHRSEPCQALANRLIEMLRTL